MNDDNGLAEALAKDAERKAKLEEWRGKVQAQVEAYAPGVRDQLATLEVRGAHPDVQDAIQGLVAMVAMQALTSALNHQIVLSAVASQLPKEKQTKALTGLNEMTVIAAEEASKIMDLLL